MKLKKMVSAIVAFALAAGMMAGFAPGVGAAISPDIEASSQTIYSQNFSTGTDGFTLTGSAGQGTTTGLADGANGYLQLNAINSSTSTGSATLTLASPVPYQANQNVVVKFDMAFAKLSGKTVSFKISDSAGTQLVYFEANPYNTAVNSFLIGDYSTTSTTALYMGYNTVIVARYTTFTFTFDFNAGTVTANLNYPYGGTSATYSGKLPSGTTNVKTLLFSTTYNNTGRYCYVDNVSITNNTLAQYNMTIAPVDGSGNPISDVAVTVKNAAGSTMTANADGTYSLAAGTYTYSLSKDGYVPQTDVSFTVSSSLDSKTIAPVMQLATGEYPVSIDVSGSASVLGTTSAQTLTYTASVTSNQSNLMPNEAVTFTVSGASSYVQNGQSLDVTIPANAPAGSVTVSAVVTAATSINDSVTTTVYGVPTSVVINEPESRIAAGGTRTYSATLYDSNSTVLTSANASTNANITWTNKTVSPASGDVGSTISVVAASEANPSASATKTLTVVEPYTPARPSMDTYVEITSGTTSTFDNRLSAEAAGGLTKNIADASLIAGNINITGEFYMAPNSVLNITPRSNAGYVAATLIITAGSSSISSVKMQTGSSSYTDITGFSETMVPGKWYTISFTGEIGTDGTNYYTQNILLDIANVETKTTILNDYDFNERNFSNTSSYQTINKGWVSGVAITTTGTAYIDNGFVYQYTAPVVPSISVATPSTAVLPTFSAGGTVLYNADGTQAAANEMTYFGGKSVTTFAISITNPVSGQVPSIDLGNGTVLTPTSSVFTSASGKTYFVIQVIGLDSAGVSSVTVTYQGAVSKNVSL
ncbi:MAG: carboxypeptidase-like regulatory domain-containing protein [Clostridia bacterium]|nr:carboxypeptidase-like regulatory domain-containing protein [Clostridia bacterium]